MKFAEHLIAHITPEWRKQYINYEEMKALLYAAVEQAPSAELVEPEVSTRYFTKFDEEFFHYCDKELTKINTFYSEKLAEATRKCACLKNELAETIDSGFKTKNISFRHRANLLTNKNKPARKMQDLKLAYSEFYLSLILLQNYQNLNFTGFRKILKKHDKLLSVDLGARWKLNHVDNSHFRTNKDIDRIIRETESTVTNELEGGDRQRAMKRLRVPPLGKLQSPWITFKVGLFSGAFIVLIAAVAISVIFHKRRDDWKIVCRLYRGPFLIIQFLFLWGFNIYGWRSSGVNHVLIFELDPRNHLSEQHVIEMASVFGVIWCLSVLSFLYSPELSIPAYANPLMLVILMIAFFINPSRTFRHEARFWALRVLVCTIFYLCVFYFAYFLFCCSFEEHLLNYSTKQHSPVMFFMGRVMLAPFFYVNFADFWVADQLNSVVILFTDFQYLICFYASNPDWSVGTDASHCTENFMFIRPLIACLPAWFRFAQCLRRYRDTKEMFPHLANAIKYATSFFVIIFTTLYHVNSSGQASITQNPYFYLWITASLISSCYAYIWDIRLDWGLFDSKAGDNKFLREEVVYTSTWLYYFAIVEDLILRFGWALSLSLIEMDYVHADIMVSILAPLEVFRRFIWNFFRLENEHLNNCGKFRAVRDISVAPVEDSDQIFLLRMMDEQDGVINRRKNKNKKQNNLDTDSINDMDS